MVVRIKPKKSNTLKTTKIINSSVVCIFFGNNKNSQLQKNFAMIQTADKKEKGFGRNVQRVIANITS